MLLKFSIGTGYRDERFDANSLNSTGERNFSDSFRDKYPDLKLPDKFSFTDHALIDQSDLMFNTQARVDFDWELGRGFLVAAGVQEMFSRFRSAGRQQVLLEIRFDRLPLFQRDLLKRFILENNNGLDIPDNSNVWNDLIINVPVNYPPDAGNSLFATSGYGLVEYTTPGNRFSTEFGLRLDHYYLLGNGFSLSSKPSLNPRLNADFNVFKNRGIIKSFDLGAGTGLFTSMNNNVFIAEERFNVQELRPNRSWTSVLGTRLEFPEQLSLNIEGYYKSIFDRMYIPISVGLDDIHVQPKFNGVGRVWGIDMMMQR